MPLAAILDLIAVFVFALTGGLVASRAQLDIVFLIDRSMSMSGPKWIGTKDALTSFFNDPASAKIGAPASACIISAVSRTVRVTTAERGVLSKEEISEYTVTTELVNPHGRPLSARIVDQIPITQNREIEVKLLRSDPPASLDALKGQLEWRLSVPPGRKAQVQFIYTLRRPRGARLVQ